MTGKDPLVDSPLDQNLKYLKLPFMRHQHHPMAKQAAIGNWSHEDYLEKLADGEAAMRKDRSTTAPHPPGPLPGRQDPGSVQLELAQKNQPPPGPKTLPAAVYQADKSNVIFLGGVGLGKTHLASALGYAACLKGNTVLFATAIDVINTLAAAQAAGRMKQELKKYTRPSLLIIDELGFLPIDKAGADLLFQVISQRYEQGALVITSNRAFKDWPEIFNNDSTLTSAILDRLLHHAETVLIEGKSYRMKDQIEV